MNAKTPDPKPTIGTAEPMTGQDKDYYSPADLAEHDEGVSEGSLSVINTAEINQQIVTAHRFPRSMTGFRRRVYELVTMDTEIAESCIYALPRDGKMITGPSIRFAEILLVGWGNHRSAAEVTDIGDEYVTAEGVFFDLETNGAIKAKIMRRIVGKPTRDNPNGKRFGIDMIATTGNAASSIALRNAILRGIPKALWKDLFDEAQKVAGGTAQTFTARRDKVMKELGIQGATPERIFALLGVKGTEDLLTEHVVHLRGLQNAIKDGETTLEAAFAVPEGASRPGEMTPPRPQKSEFERQEPKPQVAEQTTDKQAPDPKKDEAAKASEPASQASQPAAAAAESQPEDADKMAKERAARLLEDMAEFLKTKLLELPTIVKVRDLGPFREDLREELVGYPDLTKVMDAACDARQKEIMQSKAPAASKAKGK